MTRSALIIGASLAGLMTALSVSRAGFSVIVLERAADTACTGAMLSVPEGLLHRLTGLLPRSITPMIGGVNTWHAVHAALRGEAEADPNITLQNGIRVIEAAQDDDHTWVITESGTHHAANILIGADGHRSVVRRAVLPERPDATFAGYLIWLGIAQERDLAPGLRLPASPDILSSGDYHLLGSVLPGADLSRVRRHRQLGWAIYDRGWNRLLHDTGCVRNGVVHHTLTADLVPETSFAHLHRNAERWPAVWQAAIRDCVSRRSVLAVSLAEYLPERLVAGRIALVGGAAHVPTPMTGNGFSASLADAEALGRALADAKEPVKSLIDYEVARLYPHDSL